MDECIAVSCNLQWNERLLISESVVMHCGVSQHFGSMKPTWFRKRNINHAHPDFLCYLVELLY